MTQRTRADIRAEHATNKAQIQALEERNTDLIKEDLLLSDDKQWYREEMEDMPDRFKPEGAKRSKIIKVPRLIGRVYWKETFFDVGTEPYTPIEIERSRIVKIDGKWYDEI